MNLGVFWCLVVLASNTSAMKWWLREGAASVRIDTKIGFGDQERRVKRSNQDDRQDDKLPFREPLDTEGFYNRPANAGRFRVLVESHQQMPKRIVGRALYLKRNHPTIQPHSSDLDGTLDSLQFCKCVSTPDCDPRPNSEAACGADKYLCCYNRLNKGAPQYTEFFNEVEDERPMLLPGRENLARPFPPPGSEQNNFFGSFGPGHGHENSVIGVIDKEQQSALVGQGGGSGALSSQQKLDVLVGPSGPTGAIGPRAAKDDTQRSESAQRGALVGPGGPTGISGSAYGRRPVLVGPGGPAGIIGPGRGGRGSGILVGPSGLTGIIGPGYNRQRAGILTGPGGPTGTIGPSSLLIGPDGPAGQIGPQGFFG